MNRKWYDAMRSVLVESEGTVWPLQVTVHNSAVVSKNVKTQLEEVYLLNLAFEKTEEFEDVWNDPWTQALLNSKGLKTFGNAVMQHGLWHASLVDFQRAASRCEAVFSRALEIERLPHHFGSVSDPKRWSDWFKSKTDVRDREEWLKLCAKQKMLPPIWTSSSRGTASFVDQLVKAGADTAACEYVFRRVKKWNSEASWLETVGTCAQHGRTDVLEALWGTHPTFFKTQAREELKKVKERISMFRAFQTQTEKGGLALDWAVQNADTFALLFQFNQHGDFKGVSGPNVVEWALERLTKPSDAEKTYAALEEHAPFFEERGYQFEHWRRRLERRMLQEKTKAAEVSFKEPLLQGLTRRAL